MRALDYTLTAPGCTNSGHRRPAKRHLRRDRTVVRKFFRVKSSSRMRQSLPCNTKTPAFHTFLIFYIDNSSAEWFEYLSHGLFSGRTALARSSNSAPTLPVFSGRVMLSKLREFSSPLQRPLRLRTQLIAVIVAAT